MPNEKNPTDAAPTERGPEAKADFLRQAVADDLAAGRFQPPVVTRFPPEPNGYLHIGHAKAICIDFGIAADFGGRTNLRFDDTNPVKEEQEYVDAIREDIRWLGFEWGQHEYYASDYFPRLYEWACELIRRGLAYVDDQSAEEIRENRGTPTSPGRPSPFRERSAEESLALFERMKAGEFPDGSRVLRARIDMAAANLNLRDPVMYRILHAHHHRTGDDWCIYPLYDWAHGQSDSLEKVTHSLCDTGFENHRPLYDWFLEKLGAFPSRQIEFARGNITYTITSKRKLKRLVDEGHVQGWDDPRMPTLRGLRRRGYTPASIRTFWEKVGVAKRETNIDVSLLEHCIRDELNRTATRVMAVLRPLKLVITNWPEGKVEELEAVNNPEDASAGTRRVPFGRELYVERDDFMEDPPRKFFRLAPGREVRLRYGYFVRCEEAVKDDEGRVVELRCTYDPETAGGHAPDGRKVKATLHWVTAAHALDAEVRLYDRLFLKDDPDDAPEGEDFRANLNPASLEVIEEAKVEPSLAGARFGARYQFERLGYFCVDAASGAGGRPVFNRTVTLRDTWARISAAAK